MPWQDRIKPAAYTGPSGTRLEFTYEDVSRRTAKRTTAFNFPDVDGTEIQDLGRQGRRFPIRAIFWGDNHDVEALNFEELLLEKGKGKLEHPMYGSFDVVPFGDIIRKDPLKSASNQSIVEVTFWEASDVVIPAPQVDPTSAVLASVKSAKEALAKEFAEKLNIENVAEKVTAINKYKAVLSKVKTFLQPIADANDKIRAAYNAIYDSINDGLDVLVRDPITLASQTIDLVHLPATMIADVSSRATGLVSSVSGVNTSSTERLAKYSEVVAELVSDTTVEPPTQGTQAAREASNAFEITNLFASAASTATILSTVYTEYDKKPDAVASGDVILSQSEEVTKYQDTERTTLQIVDSGGAYQQRQEAAAIGAGALVQISFSLKPERVAFVLQARTIIDLCSELYATTSDEDIDKLINNNNLTGSQILELQTGDELVYYT